MVKRMKQRKYHDYVCNTESSTQRALPNIAQDTKKDRLSMIMVKQNFQHEHKYETEVKTKQREQKSKQWEIAEFKKG